MATDSTFAWDYLAQGHVEDMTWEHTLDVLNRYGERLVALYRENMEESGRPASGRLADSLRTTVSLENGGRTLAVDLSLLDYWKYIEGGTGPHWVPIAALKEWVRVKPVLPRPGSLPPRLTLEQQQDRIAYAVRWKIHEEGTEGKNDLERSLDEVWAEFQEAIGDAVSADLADGLDFILRRWALPLEPSEAVR